MLQITSEQVSAAICTPEIDLITWYCERDGVPTSPAIKSGLLSLSAGWQADADHRRCWPLPAGRPNGYPSSHAAVIRVYFTAAKAVAFLAGALK